MKSGSSSLTLAQQGFAAWRRGDFESLEEIFAPEVEWRWFEPGDWDCHDRDDVMRTLRERHAAGFAEGRLNIHEAGPQVVVATAHPSEIGGPEWPDETATVIRFRDGKVVSMQDYRTEAEARGRCELRRRSGRSFRGLVGRGSLERDDLVVVVDERAQAWVPLVVA